jgi:glycerophosphoryl diester phosphodiesterase
VAGRTSTATDARVGGTGPFVVAHRAGNRLDLLRAAEAAGVDVIEADVRLFRGRPEVRHLKSLGPVPVLWDRWELAPGWRSRLLLPELVEATVPTTELLLDLKGPRIRLAELAVEALRPYLGRRRFSVSARSERLLEPFAGLPVRRIQSVGSARRLRALLRRVDGERLDGVAIHERLLDRTVVPELRRVAGLVLTWPVNDEVRAAALAELGVDGLISDRPAAIAGGLRLERAA